MKDNVPFIYIEDGVAKGFSADLIKLLGKKVGVEIKFIPGDWHEILSAFKEGKVVAIDGISYRKERTAFTSYTKPYYRIPVVIFAREDMPAFRDISDLKGKRVGIIRDVFYEKDLRNLKLFNIEEFDNMEKLTKALSYEKIDVSISNLSQADYHIKKNSLTNVRVVGELKLEGIDGEDLRLGVNIRKPLLYSIIKKGLDAVTIEEHSALQNKWFGVSGYETIEEGKLTLSEEEKAFVKAHPVIRISNEMDWPPFDFVENNKPAGFSIDLAKIVAAKIGVELEFVNGYSWNELLELFKNGDIDVIHTLYKTEERGKFGLFTEPFYSSKNHFIVGNTTPEIEIIEDLFGKKLVVPKGWPFEEFLRENYPQIEIISTSNVIEALKAVDNGLADATIEIRAVAAYHINKHLLADLRISGWFREFDKSARRGLRFAVRKDLPILHKLVQRALKSVSVLKISQLKKGGFSEEKWTKAKGE